MDLYIVIKAHASARVRSWYINLSIGSLELTKMLIDNEIEY